MIAQPQITERKIKADGSSHDYACDLIYLSDELLVIAYVMTRGGRLPGIGLPVEPGSVSYGYFWRGRPYNLYRMKRPDGTVFVHRIDAVTGVEWSDSLLTYRDVVLDWWIPLGEAPVIEDEDEIEAAIAAGWLSADDIAAADQARDLVENGWLEIIAGAEAFERDHECLFAPLQPSPDSP